MNHRGEAPFAFMAMPNRSDVLAPFHTLMSNCRNNVLMGLRLVERTEKFPEPTSEELAFAQVAFGETFPGLDESKVLFRRWILLNGFEEIHKCLRTTLEALYVFVRIEQETTFDSAQDEDTRVKELRSQARSLNHPDLISQLNLIFRKPLEFQVQMDSFNNARNCLVHANGVVTRRHCNNREKDKLVIFGRRFKLFFKKGELEVPAKIGTPGPENAALMFGAEDFQLEFAEGKSIEISLEQFLNILSTCIFIHANLVARLSRSGT